MANIIVPINETIKTGEKHQLDDAEYHDDADHQPVKKARTGDGVQLVVDFVIESDDDVASTDSQPDKGFEVSIEINAAATEAKTTDPVIDGKYVTMRSGMNEDGSYQRYVVVYPRGPDGMVVQFTGLNGLTVKGEHITMPFNPALCAKLAEIQKNHIITCIAVYPTTKYDMKTRELKAVTMYIVVEMTNVVVVSSKGFEEAHLYCEGNTVQHVLPARYYTPAGDKAVWRENKRTGKMHRVLQSEDDSESIDDALWCVEPQRVMSSVFALAHWTGLIGYGGRAFMIKNYDEVRGELNGDRVCLCVHNETFEAFTLSS